MLVWMLAWGMGCGQEAATPTADHADHGDHAHEGAAHEGHAHEGHAHEGHAHEGHAHEAGHAAGGAAHAHAGGGGHMADMVATREALRVTLGAAYDQPVAGLAGADAARGKVAYDKACASCHGVAGKGDGPAGAALNPPPADFTDAFHARFYSDAARVHIIRKGLQGTGMAPFEQVLGDAEILDVYAHVKALRPEAGAAPGAPAGKHDHH